MRRSLLPVAASFLLFLTACGGGVRPTLTGDRLDESAVEVALVEADPTAVPAVAETTPDDTASSDPAPSDATGTDPAEPGSEPTPDPSAPVVVEELVVQVLDSFPHDAQAFTQGLELDNGTFIESTGLTGESDLRRVDPSTGEVTQQVATPNNFFAEGVTKVGDELIQLTWTEQTAFYWDATTFELNKEVTYAGQGWGLCYDGARLVMSDGTAELIFRDATTFDEQSRVEVTFNDQQVFNLNELECVNGAVWANIWQTDLIVRINPATGDVTALVDASSLASPNDSSAVLNGIAWDDSTQSFYVTGKNWPTMYRVNFVPAEG